tara:strand:- start:605 stop:748 length:144 start_codon:yes stop_codon:yes gene_type:complete
MRMITAKEVVEQKKAFNKWNESCDKGDEVNWFYWLNCYKEWNKIKKT